MSEEYKWKYDLEEYIRQGEPEQAEKSYASTMILSRKRASHTKAFRPRML